MLFLPYLYCTFNWPTWVVLHIFGSHSTINALLQLSLSSTVDCPTLRKKINAEWYWERRPRSSPGSLSSYSMYPLWSSWMNFLAMRNLTWNDSNFIHPEQNSSFATHFGRIKDLLDVVHVHYAVEYRANRGFLLLVTGRNSAAKRLKKLLKPFETSVCPIQVLSTSGI